jgi:transcriptional regulator with XRE-family HTH domain
MSINDNIKRIRKLRKMTQQQLADKIGVKRSTFAEWEDKIVPKGDILSKISKALDVSMEELISGNSEISSEPADLISAHFALLTVLLREVASLKADKTGENPMVIEMKLQKSAEDVLKLMKGNGS